MHTYLYLHLSIYLVFNVIIILPSSFLHTGTLRTKPADAYVNLYVCLYILTYIYLHISIYICFWYISQIGLQFTPQQESAEPRNSAILSVSYRPHSCTQIPYALSRRFQVPVFCNQWGVKDEMVTHYS